MKLIDVEKLLADLKTRRYSKRSLELIESQPEIKAIPSDWLNEKAVLHGVSFTMRLLIDDWEKENEQTDSV